MAGTEKNRKIGKKAAEKMDDTKASRDLLKQVEEEERRKEKSAALLKRFATIVFAYALPIAIIAFVLILNNPNIYNNFSQSLSELTRPPAPPDLQTPTQTPGIAAPTLQAANQSNESNETSPTPTLFFPEITPTPTPTAGPTVAATPTASATPTLVPLCDAPINASPTFILQCALLNGTVKNRTDERGCSIAPICVTPTPGSANATPTPTPTPEPEIVKTTAWLTEKQNYNRTGGQSYRLPKYSIRKAWEFEANGSIYASAAIANGKVFFGADDGILYALNASSGEKLWTNKFTAKIRASPVTNGTLVIAADTNGTVRGLDAETGNVTWQAKVGGAVLGTPTIYESKVVFGADNYHVYVLRIYDGTKALDYFADKRVVSSPVVDADFITFYSDDLTFRRVNKTTGAINWTVRTDNGTVSRSGKSSPIILPQTEEYWLAGDDGMIYDFYKNQSLKWQYQTGDPIHSTPAIVPGRVFAANVNGLVIGFNLSRAFTVTFQNLSNVSQMLSQIVLNTSPIWSKSIGTGVEAGISASEEAVYVPGLDGKLYVLSADGGAVLTTFATNGPIFSSPSLADGFVFLTSTDRKIYALARP